MPFIKINFLVLSFCLLTPLAKANADQKTLIDYISNPRLEFNSIEDSDVQVTVTGLHWSKNYVGLKKDVDASAFDSLIIEMENPNSQVVQLNLEIKDSQSTDYWSRVNYYFAAAPGAHTIRIPLKQRVGDTSRPGRTLDQKKIKSIILARTDVSENSRALKIKKISLKKDSSLFPKDVKAFDFGTEASPVFPGFTGVHSKTLYTKKLSYGFKKSVFWEPYKGAEDALQPDSLSRDAVFLPSGEFQIDIPNGEYDVVLNLGFSSGYWGEFPIFKKRKVFLQNNLIVNEMQTRNEIAESYFAFAETEDHENEDFFEKYYSKSLKERIFKTQVKDGRLTLRFEGDNCFETPCFGMALNYLIVFPHSNKTASYLQSLLDERKKEFQQNFLFVPILKDNSLSKVNSKADSKVNQSLDVFQWPTMKELSLTSYDKPLSAGNSLSRIAVQHQILSLSVGLRSSQDETVSVQTSSEKLKMKAWPVSRRITRLEPASQSFTIAERYLQDSEHFSLKKNESKRLWIEIDTGDTPPGTYEAVVFIQTKHQKLRYPIKVEILKHSLPEMDIPVGPFNSTITESWWPSEENTFREGILQTESLKMMKQMGLTTATMNARLEVDWNANPLKISGLDRISKLMSEFKRAHFKTVVFYNDVLQGQNLCESEISDKDLTRLVKTLKEEAKNKNWLPVQLIVCDEPVGEEALQSALKRIQFLQKLNDSTLQFGAAFSFNKNFPEARKLFQTSTLPFLNQFDFDLLKDKKKNWFFYNAADRSSFGFGLFRLKQLTSLSGRLAWNWNQNAGNPYYALDAREDDVNWCNSLLDGRLQCTVFLKRHILEGLNDYRLLLLLKNLNIQNSKTKIKADQLIKEILDTADFAKPLDLVSLKNNYEREDAWRDQILLLLKMISAEQ